MGVEALNVPGLTKGFWANHAYVWDNDGAKNTGDNYWSGKPAPKGSPYGNEGQLFYAPGNPHNVISTGTTSTPCTS